MYGQFLNYEASDCSRRNIPIGRHVRRSICRCRTVICSFAKTLSMAYRQPHYAFLVFYNTKVASKYLPDVRDDTLIIPAFTFSHSF